MIRFEEVKPVSDSSVIEIVGHSILRLCWRHAPRKEFQKPINFNILPGGTAPVLWLHLRSLALQRMQQRVRCTFGIDFIQNSVRVMSVEQIEDLLTQIRMFFVHEYNGYHQYFYINCNRAPELLEEDYGDRIREINIRLENENRDNGFLPCDPGRTLEKVKKGGRVVVKSGEESTKWREYPGYHPSSTAITAFCRYVRTWVDAQTVELGPSYVPLVNMGLVTI